MMGSNLIRFGGIPMSKRKFYKNLLVSALVVILGMAWGPQLKALPASGDLFEDTLFYGDTDQFLQPEIVRTRFVKVNFSLLEGDGSLDNGGTAVLLDLNLFGGIFFQARLIQRGKVGSSSTWVGTIDNVPNGQVVFAYKDKILSGNISVPGAFYQVRYAGDGVHAVHELDHSKFPQCAVSEGAEPLEGELSVTPDIGSDSGSSIDVLVVYNAAARAGAGGTAAMETTIALAITETNTGYANSGITQRLNLVHTAEVSYIESGSIFTDLSRLGGTTDGYIDHIHTMRNTYGADMTAMITELGGGYCGVASLMGTVSGSFASSAFSVTKRSCATGYYSFGHELGHNMSARHDRYVDNIDSSPYAYNHGFVSLPGDWRTIMAYNDDCGDNGDGHCTRINYWSNPGVTYGGLAVGIADGDPSAADNHLTLNNTAYTVANFRSHVTAPSITVTSPNGGESLTGNAGKTITWSKTGTFSDVKIEYSLNNGSSWSTETASTTNDGSYAWTVPNSTTSQGLIRISEAVAGSPTDSSNATFTITNSATDQITVTSPNGGETLSGGSGYSITWTSAGSVGNVKLEYSTDSLSTWTTIVSSTSNNGTYSWSVPEVNSANCYVRVSQVSGGTPSDTSNHKFSITFLPAEISLSRRSLDYGADSAGNMTAPQYVLVDNDGGGTLHWSTSSDASWLLVSPSGGIDSGKLTISVNKSGLGVGTYSGTVTVSDPDSSNLSETIAVSLKVYNSASTTPPIGNFSTPLDGSTAYSSIPITGWVVDDIGISSVKIYNGASYVGDAVFVEGARPDVESAYPGYPANYLAGWGYMMLTNFLPGGGNGSYTFYAKAIDVEGHEVTLGSKTITLTNNSAVKPFGAIDTPGQGGAASGSSFVNWGWVLTPMPNSIAVNGSTINVWVDGVKLGHPNYNVYRSDIANLLPGYANSDGAVGYFYLNTTNYDNGVHTIQWTATDSASNSDGIGSRYFSVENVSNDIQSAQKRSFVPGKTIGKINPEGLPLHTGAVRMKRGYNLLETPWSVVPEDGLLAVSFRELERLELQLLPNPNVRMDAGVINVTRLPIGSHLDPVSGLFTWQAGAGFYGRYELLFLINTKGAPSLLRVNVKINPRY